MKKYTIILLAIVICAGQVRAGKDMWHIKTLIAKENIQVDGLATYVPVKFKIETPPKSCDPLKVITIYTEGMYDRFDPNFLGLQFRKFGGGKYFGIESEFSQPLTLRIYMNKDEPVDEVFLKEIVEKRQLITYAHGKEKVRDLNYEFKGVGAEISTIGRREFLERYFNSYKSVSKKDIREYGDLDSKSLAIPFPELEMPLYSRSLPYLSSYLSLIDGVLGLETFLDDDDIIFMKISYVPSVITEDELWETLCSKKWRVKMKNGEIQEIDAKLSFTDKQESVSINK